jgi:hypothetical protein
VRTTLLVLVLVLLCGCGGPDLESDPAIELGTGEVEFVPLADGDPVPLTFGLQGGQHVWGALRVVGIDWREIALTFALEGPDGVALTPTTQMYTELQDCDVSVSGCTPGMGELVGATVIIEDDDAGAVVGGDVTLRVEGSDTSGRSASAAKRIDVTY